MAELELTRHLSVTVSPRLTVSNRFVANDPDGAFLQEDVTWAIIQPQLGGRAEWHTERFSVGASVDVRYSAVQEILWQPFFGVDVGVVQASAARKERRRIRRQVRKENR